MIWFSKTFSDLCIGAIVEKNPSCGIWFASQLEGQREKEKILLPEANSTAEEGPCCTINMILQIGCSFYRET